MIKLLTILTLVAGLTTGCKKKDRTGTEQEPVTAPKTVEPGAPATPTEPAQPQEKPPVATQPGGGEAMALPDECTEYRATIEKIRTCTALPQATRDALTQAYAQASSGWANAAPEQRESLAASCRSANDSIKQSAAACP
jgi:hypothetical protein